MTPTSPLNLPRYSSALHLFLLAIILLTLAPRLPAQTIDKPLQFIDEDITAFAFAPDGRIVYSVRHQFHTKEYDLQRDDIWLLESNGKRRILLKGEKFTHGNTPFTYTVNSFRWSPNARYILADLFTTSVVDDSGKTQDAMMTLVLESNAKDVHIGGSGGDSLIKDAENATWLLDSTTIVYMTEVVKPRILFSFKYVNVNAGPAGLVFEGRTFLDFAPVPHSNVAIAVERDRNLTGPPRLQRLELLAQDDRELATLDNFSGGISVSPQGNRVAYYIDKEILELRDLTDPTRVARVRIGPGVFQWGPDENRILLKRAIEKKSGDVVWIDLPALSAQPPDKQSPVSQPIPSPILHGLAFRDFAISPDGRLLGLVAPGKHTLSVFPLPPR